MLREPLQPPEPPGRGWRGEPPCDVFWEKVILPCTVAVEGRVPEIRHRLWLLATAGKAARKAMDPAGLAGINTQRWHGQASKAV